MILLFGQPRVFYSSSDYMKMGGGNREGVSTVANIKTVLSAFIYNLKNGIWGTLWIESCLPVAHRTLK